MVLFDPRPVARASGGDPVRSLGWSFNLIIIQSESAHCGRSAGDGVLAASFTFRPGRLPHLGY
jgi:hypothetical protein